MASSLKHLENMVVEVYYTSPNTVSRQVFCDQVADSSKVWLLVVWQILNVLAEKVAQQNKIYPKISWNVLMTTGFNLENGEINESEKSVPGKGRIDSHMCNR